MIPFDLILTTATLVAYSRVVFREAHATYSLALSALVLYLGINGIEGIHTYIALALVGIIMFFISDSVTCIYSMQHGRNGVYTKLILILMEACIYTSCFLSVVQSFQ